METKHTPGPWRHKNTPSNKDRFFVFWTDETKPGKWQRKITHDGAFTEANARLIAASPELLDACQTVLSEIDDTYYSLDSMSDDWKRIRELLVSAIAKATNQPASCPQ